ncbi:MAG: hypothetical protein LUE93_11695 [Bacteroides sp.]|nr:hypothetical protein [Bacteroides sp.]
MNDQDEIQLTAGTKTFFALVNAPKSLLEEGESRFVGNPALTERDARNEQLTLNDLKEIVGKYEFENGGGTFHEDDIEDTGNRGFMMTSLETVSVWCPEMDEEDHAADVINIPLGVGRAMGKASLASDLLPRDKRTQQNGDLKVQEYKVVNNPNRMLVIPSFSGLVPVTPYFYSTEDVDVSNYFESTDYIKVSAAGTRTFSYFAENSNLTPRKGNSTGIVIKGKYEPVAFLNADGTQLGNTDYDNPNVDGTFYRIKDLTKNEYENGYYHEIPTNIDPSTQEVIPYPEGICYYIIYLTDGDTPAPYCVKRNSYYKVDVKTLRQQENQMRAI